MKVFSTFTGIGGFEIGITNAFNNRPAGAIEKTNSLDNNSTNDKSQHTRQSATFVGYSEIDRYAVSVYKKHFKGVKNYGDITKINAEELPDFDCLVGGFPCQAFSIAGKRHGFEDTRGTLFFDLARILRAKQPRLFVFENVKGLLSHDNGNTFRTIIATIDELGYDCQWQVLNSKDFGVPQNRERIIIVGHLRGTARPQVFPIPGANQQSISQSAEVRPNTQSVTATYYKGGKGSHIKQLNQPTHSNDRVYDPEGIAPTLNTMQGGRRQPKILQDVRGIKKSQNGKGFKYGDDAKVSYTVDTLATQGIDDGQIVRRLTPLECERLQAFPDNWTKYDVNGNLVSDTQRYKMAGNAVTTNVIQAVFERILVNG